MAWLVDFEGYLDLYIDLGGMCLAVLQIPATPPTEEAAVSTKPVVATAPPAQQGEVASSWSCTTANYSDAGHGGYYNSESVAVTATSGWSANDSSAWNCNREGPEDDVPDPSSFFAETSAGELSSLEHLLQKSRCNLEPPMGEQERRRKNPEDRRREPTRVRRNPCFSKSTSRGVASNSIHQRLSSGPILLLTTANSFDESGAQHARL
jgi:hypothetical protein